MKIKTFIIYILITLIILIIAYFIPKPYNIDFAYTCGIVVGLILSSIDN